MRLTLVSVEDFVPVFPHGLVAEGADFAGMAVALQKKGGCKMKNILIISALAGVLA